MMLLAQTPAAPPTSSMFYVLEVSSHHTSEVVLTVLSSRCVFWGGPVTTDNAKNVGQWRKDFHVVIAGSNGYVSNKIVTPPGCSTPIYLGNAAINAPFDCNGNDT